jgi:toxin ParE1/3/4
VRVVLSNQAETDLEEIGDYIAADSPARAVSFVRELRDHFQRIAKAAFGPAGTATM